MSTFKMIKSPFSKVSHIGMVVRNLEQAIKYYESLGIRPFESFTGFDFKEIQLRGKPISYNEIPHKISFVKMGSINLELIQPVSGESLWTEFLSTRGEGINHFGFLVNNVDKEEVKMVEKGLKIIYKLRFTRGGGATYFDTTEFGGLMFELLELSPGEKN